MLIQPPLIPFPSLCFPAQLPSLHRPLGPLPFPNPDARSSGPLLQVSLRLRAVGLLLPCWMCLAGRGTPGRLSCCRTEHSRPQSTFLTTTDPHSLGEEAETSYWDHWPLTPSLPSLWMARAQNAFSPVNRAQSCNNTFFICPCDFSHYQLKKNPTTKHESTTQAPRAPAGAGRGRGGPGGAAAPSSREAVPGTGPGCGDDVAPGDRQGTCDSVYVAFS